MKNTFSEALEIALGVQNPRPREISQSSGMYFPMHSSSRQCTDSLHPDSRQCVAIILSLIHPLG